MIWFNQVCRKRQQTFATYNRDRPVEERRGVTRELKQAKCEAARNGDSPQPEPADDGEQ
jgi:hypothetical protein